MDVDGFWAECLRRWPSLEGKLQSARRLERQFPWEPDQRDPRTSFEYTDGPPMHVMCEVVAAFGGRVDWVQRRFSTGALLLAFERGESIGYGLRPSLVRPSSNRSNDPDLGSPEIVWEISRRNQWATDALPSSLKRDIRTDDALQSALQTQGYPFIASQATQVLAIDHLPMPVIGAQDQLPIHEQETEHVGSPIRPR